MARGLKLPTERQLQRRREILSTARRMISERGLDGITMRDLAAESGVALRTLYQTYGDKNSLLLTAVEERFQSIYGEIDRVEFERGVDRFIFIMDSVRDMTLTHSAYAKALSPMLMSAPPGQTFGNMRYTVYRRAIEQIARDGDLAKWADLELTTSLVRQHIRAVYNGWSRGTVSDENLGDIAMLAGATTLAAMTTGFSHEQLIAIVKRLTKAHRGLNFF